MGILVDINVPFIKTPLGAGDLVKKLTSAAGIKPCGGCQKRAEALNRTVTITPRWTVPPEVPAGWVVEREHFGDNVIRLMFYKEDTGATIIWDIVDGKYKNSKSFFCETLRVMAASKWEELCL